MGQVVVAGLKVGVVALVVIMEEALAVFMLWVVMVLMGMVRVVAALALV